MKPWLESFKDMHIKTDGCWEWTASKGDGYGVIHRTIGGVKRHKLAHRFSWEHHFGPIPDEMCVLHKCDNRGCVNPDHLFLGTQKDNMDDMWKKGRGLCGESSPKAKLTESAVLKILKDNRTLREIAAEFGVSISMISLIKRREKWKHVN